MRLVLWVMAGIACTGLLLAAVLLGAAGFRPSAAEMVSPQGVAVAVAPGRGALLREASGLRVRVLPGTFSDGARVEALPAEFLPLSQALISEVWQIRFVGAQPSWPLELTLPLRGAPPSGQEVFAVRWDGAHWVRLRASTAGPGAVRAQLLEAGAVAVGADPVTYLTEEKVSPALLKVEVPAEAAAGERVPVSVAAANLGQGDLRGFGVLSARLLETRELAVSRRVYTWDGTDGPFGATVYATDPRALEGVTAGLVDLESLGGLAVTMPDFGKQATLEVRLDFYNTAGLPIAGTALRGEIVLVGASQRPVQMGLPPAVTYVRPMGLPMTLAANGRALEDFDASGTFQPGTAREVARNWGAYQSGVAARFRAGSGAGVDGSAAQILEARGARFLGIMRQVKGLAKGEEYLVSASYRIEETDGKGLVRLGIDAAGGVDPTASRVVWVEGSIVGNWATLSVSPLVAEGDTITIFLELADKGGGGDVTAAVDDVQVLEKRAQGLPDLYVESIWVEQRAVGGCAAGPAALLIQVRNRGGGRAGSFNTVVTGTGSRATCGPWRVRGLDPGEPFVFSCELVEPGERQVRAVVDASNEVAELEENNNWRSQTVTVLEVCPPTPRITPRPTTSPSASVTPTPTVELTPTALPQACGFGAPLCPGSQVRFRLLDADWTLSLEGMRRITEEDPRWVTLEVWGQLARSKRHNVEKLVSRLGDADLGRLFGLTVTDDHGYLHSADEVRVQGALAAEARLQFEDVKDLSGLILFTVRQFPAPSAIGTAVVRVGLEGLEEGGQNPVSYVYVLGEGCCYDLGRKPLGEPQLSPEVEVGQELELLPRLFLQAKSASFSQDGSLLWLELEWRNDDYVALKPNITRALVINGNWQFGAYLSDSEKEPLGLQEAARPWQGLAQEGVPPLSEQARKNVVLKLSALAPAGHGSWQGPLLIYFPDFEKALSVSPEKQGRASGQQG